MNYAAQTHSPAIRLHQILLFLIIQSVALVADARAAEPVRVEFSENLPIIDGHLDSQLRDLRINSFTDIARSDKRNPRSQLSYRIAYGAEFLYLYIEVESDRIRSRDRGYQNGDGFHIAITTPRSDDRETDEFYVLGFSPQNALDRAWQRAFTWYHNVDLAMNRLQMTEFEWSVGDGKIRYELLLPWSELYPYHPWISNDIGFNLCYVQAIGDEERNYYYVVKDRLFQSEQSNRLYTRLNFDTPVISNGWQAYATLERNHIYDTDSVIANIAIVSDRRRDVEIMFNMKSGEGSKMMPSRVNVIAVPQLIHRTYLLGFGSLAPGGYQLTWSPRSDRFDQSVGLSVLPSIDLIALHGRINALEGKLRPGSITTLTWMAESLGDELLNLRRCETAASERFAYDELDKLLTSAENGNDILAKGTGVYRRAYRSKIDQTLQPYSVRIPDKFDPSRKYPLFVFLHGSGQDDVGQLDINWTSEAYIELAPNGRGTSNCYTMDNAQDDIREAIEDVIANYPIDTTRIVLAGFSVGGYGLHRTYYESPERYSKLAVFSGIPNLASRWLERRKYPNFFRRRFIEIFDGTNMFVYHGQEDRNAPYEETERFVGMLHTVGAQVMFVVEPGKGHQFPGAESMRMFREWLHD